MSTSWKQQMGSVFTALLSINLFAEKPVLRLKALISAPAIVLGTHPIALASL